MSAITWPASLPQEPLVAGFTEQAPNTRIRSQMEAGPAKVRRRFTAGTRNFDCHLYLSADQVEALDAFYVSTLAGGALSFGWKHPRTQAAVTYRFVEPPSYKPVKRGSAWQASLKLEVLP